MKAVNFVTTKRLQPERGRQTKAIHFETKWRLQPEKGQMKAVSFVQGHIYIYIGPSFCDYKIDAVKGRSDEST